MKIKFCGRRKDDALLAYYMAKVAEKNKLSANDMAHIFPLIMRMLKSNSDWAK